MYINIFSNLDQASYYGISSLVFATYGTYMFIEGIQHFVQIYINYLTPSRILLKSGADYKEYRDEQDRLCSSKNKISEFIEDQKDLPIDRLKLRHIMNELRGNAFLRPYAIKHYTRIMNSLTENDNDNDLMKNLRDLDSYTSFEPDDTDNNFFIIITISSLCLMGLLKFLN